MTKMIFELDDEVEEKFRKTIAEVKGLHKGVIKESIEEAIEDWIKKHRGVKR